MQADCCALLPTCVAVVKVVVVFFVFFFVCHKLFSRGAACEALVQSSVLSGVSLFRNASGSFFVVVAVGFFFSFYSKVFFSLSLWL